MKSKLVTPHAAVLVWNYDDRVDSSGAFITTHSPSEVVIGTSSIISISTSKQKSNPVGTFEVRLAPRFNWVTRITPGSWCAILMSQDKLPTMSKNNIGTASEDSFKMLGRVDSVRAVVDVDQTTGARRTFFIMSGRDWGSVFESILYIDPIMLDNQFGLPVPVPQLFTILGLNMYSSYEKDKGLPSSEDLVDAIIKVWGGGATGSAALMAKSEFNQPIMSKPFITTQTQFRLPKEVASFMKQSKGILGSNIGSQALGAVAYNFGDIITKYHGRLTKEDKGQSDAYKPTKEGFAMPNPHNLFGQNTMWQLLTELGNVILNEIVTDIRWENGAPIFALYHRIKPFVNDSFFLDKIKLLSLIEKDVFAAESLVKELVSLFRYVKKVEIELEDIVNINFGTNWRDKINFIEITPTSQSLDDTQKTAAKLGGQTYDPIGYERDGFKPLMVPSPFLPYEADGKPVIEKLTYWKFLLREWHFNNHLLLNGAVTFIGQNKYIQVGDNVIISSKILGSAPLNIGQKSPIPKDTFLLAHVENISHTFSVNQETGARSFMTTVQFVRGVMTDKSGVPLVGGNALDKFASILKPIDERNPNVFGMSVESDPDEQKLGKDGIL